MIQFSLVFNRKNQTDAKGKALVQIRAYLNGKNRYFSAGIRVEPQRWSRRLCRVVDCVNAPELNAELKRRLEAAERFALDRLRSRGGITLEDLDEHFRPETAAAGNSFIDFAHNELEKADICQGSRRHRRYSLGLLKAFCPNACFSDLNYSFVSDYDLFLRRRGLHTNTVAKHHQTLRIFINLAIHRGLAEHGNPYMRFRIKQSPTERIALSEQEIERLEELELIGSAAQVRDMFLLGCWTGLRFSDMIQLTPKHLSCGDDGDELRLRAQKTQKPLVLPLDLLHGGKPAALIRRYVLSTKTKTLFAPISNQAANRLLKTLAPAANIPKTLTMHIARHTFATRMAAKIPVHILQQLLQHGDLRSTMVYVHTSNRMVNDALKDAF